MNRSVLITAVAAAASVVALVFWTRWDRPATPAVATTSVTLTADQEHGRRAFEARCAACHGVYGLGTDHGPPLIHKIYEPAHHPDQAFEYAARFGARAHHWKFGNMPPVADLVPADIALIIDFVRAVQRANGIE